jgi:hypothetical protein
MKQDIKDKWVAALRSGDYKQDTTFLKLGDCFCVMGVLCDVVKEDLGLDWEFNGSYSYIDRAESIIPKSIAEYVEFDGVVVLLQYNDVAHDITRLNDTVKLSFDELANLIEDQL